MGVDGRHRLISILGFSCQGYICGFSHQKNIFGIYVKTYFWDLRQKYYFNLGWEFRAALSSVKAFISVDLHQPHRDQPTYQIFQILSLNDNDNDNLIYLLAPIPNPLIALELGYLESWKNKSYE